MNLLFSLFTAGRRSRRLLAVLSAALLPAMPPAWAGEGDAAGQTRLEIFNDGRLTRLRIGGSELLQTKSEQTAFSMTVFDGARTRDVPLDQVERRGDEIHLGWRGGLPRFVMRVRESDAHIGLDLVRAENTRHDQRLGLKFRAEASVPVAVVGSDYMVVDRSKGRSIEVAWPYLGQRADDDPLGGFSFHVVADDAANDRALAEIWAQASLPRPQTGKPWTSEAVLEWVADYHAKFAGLSETTLTASSGEELMALTNRMKEAGIRRIYLHTNTWRGEYWPRRRSFVDVNPEVFPGGRADLKRYADHLRANGMQLRLHNVSGGIGRNDPEFVTGGRVSRELAGWAEGELDSAVRAGDTELRFRPAPGASVPVLHANRNMHYNFFRVGEEIVKAGAVEDTDQPVWRLMNCERGFDGTRAADHPAGRDVSGLFSAYGQNYIPDPAKPLFRVMAGRYADFVNEIGLDHQHYDGYEIHDTVPWGAHKFSYLVAGRLNRSTTTSTSGGRVTPWNLETRFSAVKDLKEIGYWPVVIPILLEEHRNASSWLDAHFEVADRLLLGGRRLGFGKPEPMFGISREIFDGHGLTPRYQALLGEWFEAMPLLAGKDMAWLRGLLKPADRNLNQRGNHFQSRDVPVLEKRENGFYFVPTRVLAQEGVDGPWIAGQEFGPYGPRQYVQPGDTVKLDNPYGSQAPGIVLKVLPALVETRGADAVRPGGRDEERDDRSVSDYRLGADLARGGATGGAGRRGSAGEGGLWPGPGTIENSGTSRVTLSEAGLTVTARNPHSQPIWTEDTLPHWPCALPMRERRGVLIDVVGDGSGAVLVLQLKGPWGVRDYPVKIDFSGRRTVVIPNGEVAWSRAFWGWRFATKHFRGSQSLASVSLGLGYLPPNTSAKVVVERLALLENQPAELHDPVIRVGGGSLSIQGTVSTGEYLTWEAGEGVRVHDRNWVFLRTLPATPDNWTAPTGEVEVSVRASGTERADRSPWMELQVLTRGRAHRLGVPLPTGGAR